MPLTIHSPADITRQLLIDLGHGTDADADPLGAWPVYVSGEPSIPDNCLTCYDTPESPDEGRAMATGEILGHYGIQVRVRSTDHRIGYSKAYDIWVAFSEEVQLQWVTIDGYQYLVWCYAKISDITPLGRDSPATKRILFTINALVSFGG